MLKSKYLKVIGTITILTIALVGCGNETKNDTSKQSKEPTTQSQNKSEKKASYYYSANEGGSISKIDAATNKVLETIKDKGSPHNVQVSPDGKVLAATSAVKMKEGQTEHGTMSMNGSALFYDVETNKLIKEVEVGKHPAHVVYTSDGKYALVTNNEDNNVSVIDTKDYNVVGKIFTGNGPHGFRISKDNKFAYVANMNEDTISVLDIVNFKEIRKIKVGKTPVTTGITSDGKTLVATVNGENILAVVDLATDKVEKIPVGVGPAQVYLQSDDKFAFVANQGTESSPSNTVSKIDLTAKKTVATIETGKGAHGVVTTADNKFVYVTNMYDNTISVIDNSQNKVIATVPTDKTPNGISYRESK
ncbi:YncE family protein [Clostridium sp. CX1]|uniref:YncE family protein n=1 Tax=Clostridium sp. CX1 TaxID=2978346 RepID=UPI0021C12AD3|nr:YncE family protein [Clostridium sp. CX1]MCT8975217.1 YncE family protein [Clostridium sp. CX1]